LAQEHVWKSNKKDRVSYVTCRAERASSQSLAAAAVEGRVEMEYLAQPDRLDLPFPFIDCPECDGTVRFASMNECILYSVDAFF
jgi:hypothetical protein